MCFYHDGEVADIYEIRVKTARKPHECNSCGKRMAVGVHYLDVSWLVAGDGWGGEKVCNLCVQDAVTINDWEKARGCTGSEAWAPWNEVHGLISVGQDSDFQELEHESGPRAYRPCLFWPYGSPPANRTVNLKDLLQGRLSVI